MNNLKEHSTHNNTLLHTVEIKPQTGVNAVNDKAEPPFKELSLKSDAEIMAGDTLFGFGQVSFLHNVYKPDKFGIASLSLIMEAIQNPLYKDATNRVRKYYKI